PKSNAQTSPSSSHMPTVHRLRTPGSVLVVLRYAYFKESHHVTYLVAKGCKGDAEISTSSYFRSEKRLRPAPSGMARKSARARNAYLDRRNQRTLVGGQQLDRRIPGRRRQRRFGVPGSCRKPCDDE